jgi:hypothetical protein
MKVMVLYLAILISVKCISKITNNINLMFSPRDTDKLRNNPGLAKELNNVVDKYMKLIKFKEKNKIKKCVNNPNWSYLNGGSDWDCLVSYS